MNSIDLLILSGPPGAGKSTLANAVSENLRESEVANAVIDLDDLARVTPEDFKMLASLKWENLAAIWPNFVRLGTLKVMVPVVIDTAKDLESIRMAAPANSITICELNTPTEILKDRVTKREPNEFWRDRLRFLVDKYEKGNEREFIDFNVSTHNVSVEDSAASIVKQLGW